MWCCEQPTRIVGARKASRRSATARLSSSPSIESVPIGMWWPCCSTAPKAITIVSRPASSSRRMSGHVSVYRSSAPTASSRGCLGGRLQAGAKHRHAGRLRAASSRLRTDHDLLGPVQPGDAGRAGSIPVHREERGRLGPVGPLPQQPDLVDAVAAGVVQPAHTQHCVVVVADDGATCARLDLGAAKCDGARAAGRPSRSSQAGNRRRRQREPAACRALRPGA